MTTNFYLPRKLYDQQKEYTEYEVTNGFQIIVILAEPGAGKSSLLENLAAYLNVKKKTANTFMRRNNHDENSILIIDALDELVRIDQSAVTSLLGKAADLEPCTLIISSRSSEWDESYTKLVKDFFDTEPKIFRLFPFNELEQQQIFENYKPEENFKAFASELKKYNLNTLLSNPQFLKIFADGYIESARVFVDRKSIFSQAITALAKEINSSFNVRNDLPLQRKIEFTEEIFAKLLLSGSEGVSTNLNDSETLYPRIDTLIRLENTDQYLYLLSSRLFKLADDEGQHHPNHKIIAEFAAAHYLVKKINASRYNISLHQCLSIMAPNGVVRDELRGLLAWMAALGDKAIQETLINIDPYAVLANGDPSQLSSSSKQLLLEKLTYLAEEDPYFRRSDMWRNFSVSGFFDNDSVPIVKSILGKADKGLLRSLILELLENSTILKSVETDLEEILLDENIDNYIRKLAGIRLLEVADYDVVSTIEVLITKGTHSSLSNVENLIKNIDIKTIPYKMIFDFLEKCTILYPEHNDYTKERTIDSRYFIRNFISDLDYELVVNLLDSFSRDLCCTCKKEHYDCFCRNGISKVIGILLDRYFELEQSSYDSQRIWAWLKNLNFHSGKREEDSIAVKVIQNEDNLRHSLIKLAFEGIASIKDVHQVSWRTLSSYTHSGLCLKLQDYYFILDWAFENDNTNLWSCFAPIHQFSARAKSEVNFELRRHAKSQAREKPEFLKAWIKNNLASKENHKETQRIINRRRIKNGKLKRQNIRNENIQYIQKNRELIESGKHWRCLLDFANLTLNKPERIIKEFGDEELVKTALKNCLKFLETDLPNLEELAKAHCNSSYFHTEIVLYASCLEIFREEGNLERVGVGFLQVLRTGMDSRATAVSDKEHEALKNEVDRIIFPDSSNRLQFIRDYIEPQLTYSDCKYTKVSWLSYDDIFKEFQTSLPLEWLYKYPNISIDTAKTLFDQSAQFCDKDKLKDLIAKRCEELNTQLAKNTSDLEDQKSVVIFWFTRALFFLDEIMAEPYWKHLKEQEKIIFILSDRAEGIRHGDHPFWPALTPTKIWWILDEFIDQWPKVNLPNSSGLDDPSNETAYRFLKDLIWNLVKYVSENTLLIVNNLIADSRFENMRLDLKSIRSTLIRNLALVNFKAPSSQEIVNFLDNDGVITVESLRALILEELRVFQADLNGSETTSKDVFYNRQYISAKKVEFKRLGEVDATLRVADRLRLRLEPKGITITPEHQLQNANRCDITFSKMIDNRRRLLVLESKGQWHSELYNAASAQLFQRYSIHPHAEQQGIYFVLWFGSEEKVANLTNHGISSAQELKISLENHLSNELKGCIDIFVLDVSL
ncbi:hypothetical protein ABTF02_13990 [Acinetobacter baumannii]